MARVRAGRMRGMSVAAVWGGAWTGISSCSCRPAMSALHTIAWMFKPAIVRTHNDQHSLTLSVPQRGVRWECTLLKDVDLVEDVVLELVDERHVARVG
jgi:hypothetical protein